MASAASTRSSTTDASSASSSSQLHVDPTKLEVILFGIGDLRTADHPGLTRAVSSGSTVLPLLLLDSDTLSKIPGGASHVLDTEMMLASAISSLATRLKEDVGLDLHVYSRGQSFDESMDNALRLVKENASGSAITGITINVCDLGDADNDMGYGPYAHLQDCTVLDNDDSAISISVKPWDCSLRTEPWTDLHDDYHLDEQKRETQSKSKFPTQYPAYEKQYQIKSRDAIKPDAVPPLDASGGNMQLSIPELQAIPDSKDVLKIICRSLDLDTECPETRKILENERNTGLYGSHWGGMDGATLSETDVLAGLEAFASCNEDDDAFLQSKWWQSRRLERNGRSLEHASITWMMRGDSDDDFAPIKTANLLKGEFMVRYLAAPLLFGTVSSRTVWHMASLEEGGALDFIPLFRKSSVLRDLVEGREWHRIFAAKNIRDDYSKQEETPALGVTQAAYWRWHGFLCRYEKSIVAKSTGVASNDLSMKEGIVLVHGFGASGSQWSKAIKALTKSLTPDLVCDDEYEAVAPDLLGFGESEKPQLSYTQYLWESNVASFIKEVCVRESKWDEFVIGGNSIGGYTSMGVAADDRVPISDSINGVNAVSASGAPGTNRCTGLVLMNSAGRILSREEVQNQSGLDALVTVGAETAGDDLPKCRPPPRALASFFGTGLLGYLRPRIQSICKNLYPTNPDAVDETLTTNILRDSLDPGAINVMISGSKLPPPRTANELLGADFGSARSHSKEDSSIISAAEGYWTGRTLVAQGILDPLNDAKTRSQLLGALRSGVDVSPITAGHCPHDELPDEVAGAIAEWMTKTKSSSSIESSSMIIA
eukprot:CAMPEP_0178571782 /NCGR_PEP_ID=MMETSP0697-20121206/17846_1 /TAXON_ID=265572 /ORGANISM="Extubocellulus spinifer, Strain CCMP396" /LENGTH=826 /DNA_ID=CAMNT_0020206413 /DNA_START=169 /DNA_END=2649 /DNA_ORIENTATION=+